MSCSGAGPASETWPARPRRSGPGSRRSAVSSAPGASALTAAELRLLPMLSTHLSFPEIAEELFLSRQHHQVAGELALPQAGRLLTQPGGHPGPRAGAPGGLTIRLSPHQGDGNSPRARGGMVLGERAEAYGPDGEIPGDVAQAGDDRRRLRRRPGRARAWPGRGIGPGSQDRGAAASRRCRWPSGHRRSAWNGAPAGRWRRARARTRSPTCCWRSPRWPGSAGSSPPRPSVATALGYDIAAALEEPDESLTASLPVTSTCRRTGGGASPEAEDEQPERQARMARREASSGACATEAGMASRGQPEGGWTVVLRRQPARIMEGRPEGGYTDTFEIVCCDCGDHPYLDYCQVSPELQRLRGPCSIEAAVAAYEQHLRLHQQPEAAHRTGTMTDAG